MKKTAGLMLACLGAVAIGIGAAPARAEVIASDSFNYTAGSSILGANGGTGWGGAWFNAELIFGNLVIGAGNLSYPGLPSSGGNAQSQGNSTADGRALAGVSTSYGDVVWVSFVSNFSTQGYGFDNLRFLDNSTLTAGIGGNGSSSGDYTNWSILNSSLAASTFTNTPLNGQTALALMEIDYTTGTSSLWMDPNLSTFIGSQTPGMTVDFAPVFTQIQLFVRPSTTIDQLTLATTYQEALGEPAAVPEPPSSAVLAGGLVVLGMVSRGSSRRRRGR